MDEGDFIDDKEVKGAVQLGVLKESDAVATRVGERNGMEMRFATEAVQSVAALVWDTLAADWADDLGRFARHAGRSRVQTDDVRLLCRRNPGLLAAALNAAGLDDRDDDDGDQARTKSAVVKTRKRKMHNANSPAKPSKLAAISSSPSIGKTPRIAAKRSSLTSSTPKTVTRPLRFSQEMTPIRANQSELDDDDDDDAPLRRLPKIDEVTLEESAGNLSSLLKAAENHGDDELIDDAEERDRLEALIPDDDSFDEFFVAEQTRRRAGIEEKKKTTTTTISSDASKSNETKRRKSTVFSNAMSAFGFDDDEDSFDDYVPEKVEKIASRCDKTATNCTSIVPETPKTSSTTSFATPVSRKNKSVLKKMPKNDSFDEFDFDI